MSNDETTYQRINKATQKNLQRIAKVHKPKVTVPVLLDVITERELKRYPELQVNND